MKPACCLFVATLGLAVTTGALRADASDSPAGNEPVNPFIQTDANGTPLAVLNPNLAPLTPDEQNEIRQEQKRVDSDKDWLIRNYERALQNRSNANPNNFQSANLYYHLSTNPDLARLAGLPDLGAFKPATAASTQAPAWGASNTPTAAPSSIDKNPALMHAFDWKPLITPLSSPDAVGLKDIYGSEPTAMPSPLGGDTAADSVASDHQPAPKTQDILDLETPGMVASKDDPNAQINAPDLTLDVLPGETVAQAKADRARETSIRPPEPMSVEQLRQSLLPSAALPATPSDGITNTASSIPPPAPAYSPETDPSAPVPVSRQPVINPVHAPIANPFDILNR